MTWQDEWETTRYVYSLTDDDANVLRVRIRTERGRVVRFTVQYEAIIDSRVFPIVRYDTAHDYAHRDVLDWQGRVIRKDPIAGPDRYHQALTDAINDLKANWPSYRAAFLEKKP